jgi:penicillin amidase
MSAVSAPSARGWRRLGRWAGRGLAALLVLVVAVLLAVWLLLRASLPALDGRIEAQGAVGAPVRIERDARGSVTVRGRDLADVAFGLGLAHAQDRYFQMDVARRVAAGELAELFGAAALAHDRRARVFGFRGVAREVVAGLAEDRRRLLETYARGVNAGLAGLRARPWEYWLLRLQPQPWSAEDTVLVVHAMWWQLQHGAIEYELEQKRIEAQVRSFAAANSGAEVDASRAETLLDFLFPRGTEWDSPVLATAAAAAAALPRSPPLPPPAVLDLRRTAAPGVSPQALPPLPEPAEVSPVPGSNAWAVAGRHAGHRAALLANDMHLGLGVPATWYRTRLVAGEQLDLVGVSLPGAPAVVVGSNGRIAWGFTNSLGDWSDVSLVSCDPPKREYRTQAGPRRFAVRRETLRVRGGEPVALEVLESPLGVLVDFDAAGKTCALARWLAVEPGVTNLEIFALASAQTVAEALDLAAGVGVPHQNLIVADRDGSIAWTVLGRIPRSTAGPSAASPVIWRAASEQPRIVDPESGYVWSANARPVEGEAEIALAGDEVSRGAGYDLGARARQIRDALFALREPATPAAMLAIQLDDRALFLARWRTLLLALLDEQAVKNAPQRLEMRLQVERWGGRAAPDSVGYRIVREFRERVSRRVWSMLMRGVGLPADTPLVSRQFEGPLWRLVSEQPEHLLPPDAGATWTEFLLRELDSLAAALRGVCGRLENCTFGDGRPVRIRHPLSGALPGLSHLIDMPQRTLPGDSHMPRVQAGAFGASERLAVAPGREAEGYLQLPGGQSGHPLSPFYRSSFDAWAEGRPEALLPGPVRYRIEVVP